MKIAYHHKLLLWKKPTCMTSSIVKTFYRINPKLYVCIDPKLYVCYHKLAYNRIVCCQVVQQGQELAAAIAEASEVMAAGAVEGSEAAPLDAQARVQVLLEFLHDRQLDLEECAEERRARFEQCVQLGEYTHYH